MELTKYGSFLLRLRFLRLYNMCWKGHKMPKQWAILKAISLFKKGSRTDPANYRGTSLIRTAYKCYDRILNMRVRATAENIGEVQMNFQRVGHARTLSWF